ncbi:TrbI/VirB10 family protein [Sphingomonas asaccharolytica]|uniref:TrbI/VirB10 family protein n=1 Tax=Sphingomonas asaccharolytica TaxID=40681 RepID=UPI00082AFB2D|nr:TrbI/VirB10 family protein [Sphingomonas asaccharolytica]
MTDETEIPAATPKADPESLAIRARPRRAIRFRRGVIIAAAALGSVSVTAVTWMALKPTVFRQVAQEELPQPGSKASPDALNGLPSSYGDVPKLGPPLPGDLGRPILDRQRQLAAEGQVPPADPAAQAAAAERERLLAERKAARESGLLATRSQAPNAAAATPAPSATGDAAAPAAKLALDPANDPNNQQRKADFMSTLDPRGDINPHAMAPSPSPYLLSAGSVISASLITGLRSDLPGLVTAQVTERIYDSPTGRILLIPQGARLVGSYDSVVAFGQKRALIVWQRIILPDGSAIRIDNMPATDPAGYAGLEDQVDFHTWSLLKGITLSTLLGVGTELQFSGETDLIQAVRQSSQLNVSRAGDQVTMRHLQIQPTITIRPGAEVRLLVSRDLVLAPWREGQ